MYKAVQSVPLYMQATAAKVLDLADQLLAQLTVLYPS